MESYKNITNNEISGHVTVKTDQIHRDLDALHSKVYSPLILGSQIVEIHWLIYDTAMNPFKKKIQIGKFCGNFFS